MILALPRTGTKMLVSALHSHPDMPPVIHEFRGGLWKFLKKRYVLSNEMKWWMRWPIKVMHVGREDSKAGARSLIMMSYRFPPKSFNIPKHEIDKLAKFREATEAKMRKRAQWSTTYEALSGGRDARKLDMSLSICKFLGVSPRPLFPSTKKTPQIPSRNEAEL